MPAQPNAVLVAVKLPDVSEAELQASLDELERLVTTLGYRVTGRVTQARSGLAPAAVLGEGKLQELAELTGGSGDTSATVPRKLDKARARRLQAQAADDSELASEQNEQESDQQESDEPESAVELVVVDHEISPSQLRNLERATGTRALDRTGLIIEIFHRHARSREAKMQVEIARLKYESPRIRESPRGKERQRGRGAGEAALELDRRRIRDRIAELGEALELVQRERAVQRAQREEARSVALVGYTNAGKSSLMRGLTGSEVYVEDKLFATLDTTVRALKPEVVPRILVSDTVGFIKKLPHDLVASFKSTLDEASAAALLLHVVDASDPQWPEQREVTRSVLAEIGARPERARLVLNKIDRLDPAALEALREAEPEAWFVSAHDAASLAALRERIVAHFEADYVEQDYLVPYSEQRFVSEAHEAGRVLSTQYVDEGVIVRLRTDSKTASALAARLARANQPR